jgi:hypothetical protein
MLFFMIVVLYAVPVISTLAASVFVGLYLSQAESFGWLVGGSAGFAIFLFFAVYVLDYVHPAMQAAIEAILPSIKT